MKEECRKCVKCGSSPIEDSETVLFRFPKPGTTNIRRSESWARYIFPNKPWATREFQMKLYNEHRMLCHRHFKETAFIDYAAKKLHRFAYPEVEVKTFPEIDNVGQPIANPSQALTDISNTLPTSISGPSEINVEIPGSSKTRVIASRMDIEIPSTSKSTIHVPETSGMLFEVPGSLKPSVVTSGSSILIRCKKYVHEIRKLKKKIKYLEKKDRLAAITTNDAVNKLAANISPEFAIILQGQLRNYKKMNIKSRKWTLDDKITSLRIYKRSPTCYRLLRRMFSLPCPTTLKVLLRKCTFEVGINKNVFEIVGNVAKSQAPMDNQYVLMFDEMSIRKHFEYNIKKDLIEGFQDHGIQGRTSQPASHALVFMVAGIRQKSKQPMAYYLSGSSVTADRLVALIKEVLGECYEYGINIAVTVCDMDGVNRRSLHILGANVSQPYFENNNRTIFAIFDTPHLIKCFRNLFMKYNIECTVSGIESSDGITGKGIAKWSHIIELHDLEMQNKNFVYAPGLKRDHLYPNTKQKMKVCLATQVLSHTVAAGLYARVGRGELPAEAVVTADTVAKMDSIFDTLNADSSDCRRGKPLATNWKRNDDEHNEIIAIMKKYFETAKFVGARSKPPSQEGWLWTLNGVQMLWESLTKRHKDIKRLATRRLQQDALENLFGTIRAHCGANTNPTSVQFVAGIKTALFAKLSHITSGNCQEDNMNCMIENVKILLKNPIAVEISDSVTSKVSEEWEPNLMFHEELHEECSETDACSYVCGFILKNITKIMKNTNCETCKNIMYASQKSSMHLFTEFKEYSHFKKSLNYASKNFVCCVQYIATCINMFLEENAHKKDLLKTISDKLRNDTSFNFLNECPVHNKQIEKFLIKSVFHINVKRFCIKKNRSFSEETNRAALIKKIDILKHK